MSQAVQGRHTHRHCDMTAGQGTCALPCVTTTDHHARRWDVATIAVDLDDAEPPTPTERIIAFAASIGRPLAPWQIRHLERQVAREA